MPDLLLVAPQVPGMQFQGEFGTNGYGSRSTASTGSRSGWLSRWPTSVNPARSLGPAVFVGPAAPSQVWLFLVAPLVGGALAAAVHRVTHPTAHHAEIRETGPGRTTA
ncbi:aquaporin [Streptomyces sp. NPDC088254]|uniref:aquaporin n=1 Tax=Streptomyces sp. NPDC088254 TaxID=3365847 RepID=UPI0038193747